jgi:predicted nucleotidyltransferase
VQQLSLDTAIREALTQRILTALESAASGSTAELRGSLVAGNADAYSDIDILWEIPDSLFQVSVDRIKDILSAAHPVEFSRSDPNFQNSDRRRLFFVQFQDIPLFWRTDIDVLAQSVQGDFQYDVNNQSARGDDWSLTHSALMNAIAAVKALLRHEEEKARQLLARGFQRVGLVTPAGDSQELILKLAEDVAAMDATKADLARRIVELHRRAFGQVGAT